MIVAFLRTKPRRHPDSCNSDAIRDLVRGNDPDREGGFMASSMNPPSSGSAEGDHLVESRQSTAHECLRAHAPQPSGELRVRGQSTYLQWMPVRVIGACHSCYFI